MRQAPNAALLVACLMVPACSSPGGPGQPPGIEPPGMETPGLGTEPYALAKIARLEDRRDGERELCGFLARDQPSRVRARAALALGRLAVPQGDSMSEGTSTLLEALDDPASDVRAAAAFALGQRGDAAAAQALLDHWLDPEPEVRAQVVRAAGRIGEPRLRVKVLAAMRSPLEIVRLEAVSAPFGWPTDAADAETVDQALSEVASRVARGSLAAERLAVPSSSQESPEVIWRALFSLQRRGSAIGRDVYHTHRNDPRSPLARLFAAKGLAQVERHEAGRVALEAALFDADWRVAVEAARGLGIYGDPHSLDALLEALESDVVHLRVAVAEALGAFRVGTERAAALAASLRDDRSPNVRAAAMVSEAKLHHLTPALVQVGAADQNAVVRAGAALAASELPSSQALPILLGLTRDAHPRVAGTAVTALGRHPSPETHARLLELIDEDDNGLKVAAIDALGEDAGMQDVPLLRRAYSTAEGDIAADVRASALRLLTAIDQEVARGLLAGGTRDDAARSSPGAELPAPWDPAAPNPMVEIVTTRGTMLFELFPREAPVHVHSFLQLAERDHFDGLDFHRVVGDVVIQGGCYRGDGNGTGTWRAAHDTLRHEFGRRRFVRGSLAMPRGAELDSGGSQIFVTHRPTPHLDGRYTIFGELREGGAVLDAIQVGDRILDVRRR